MSRTIGTLMMLSAGLVILTGCATPVYRTYTGTRSLNEIAILEPDLGLRKDIPLLCKIDGKPGPKRYHFGFGRYSPRYNSMNGGKFRAELEPGKHTLTCSIMQSGTAYSMDMPSVSFVAEAGKTYKLGIKRLPGRTWKPVVVEAR